jgi:CheY-like chemotaxis protein
MTKPKILIVEDESLVARDIGQQLLELGYEPVAETRRAEDAILLAGQLQPDLVLMDIHLAGEMDGLTAAEIIRDRFSIPVVFLTALAGDLILNQANLTEPFDCIIKPFDERELQTVIEMALCKHRAAQAGAAPLTDPKNSALLC